MNFWQCATVPKQITLTPGCGAICPLLKVEIFRDFAQMVGLFFSSLYNDTTIWFANAGPWITGVADTLGKVFNMVALDLYAIVASERFQQIAIVVACVLAVVVWIAVLWLLYLVFWCAESVVESTTGHWSKCRGGSQILVAPLSQPCRTGAAAFKIHNRYGLYPTRAVQVRDGREQS